MSWEGTTMTVLEGDLLLKSFLLPLLQFTLYIYKGSKTRGSKTRSASGSRACDYEVCILLELQCFSDMQS